MNLDFTKLFTKKGEKPPVTIKALKDMILTVDGVSRHVSNGETVTIAYEEFGMLASDDRTVISGLTQGEKIQDPSPARPTPAPAPAAWASLPACFREFFDCEQEIAVARRHIDLIRRKRLEIFGSENIDFTGAKGTILVGRFSGGGQGENGYSSLRPLNFDDPRNQKLARFLQVAEDTARDYLARLIQTRSLQLQRWFLECGDHRITAAEELDALLQDLAATGFEIFALRIQALGLAEHHVRRLFHGSGDFQRYAGHSPAYLGEVCFAGYNEHGVNRRYSDIPVESSAGHLLRDIARLAELKPLLAAAKKELARAQKAALPVGLPA